jgi:hypothetical protein
MEEHLTCVMLSAVNCDLSLRGFKFAEVIKVVCPLPPELAQIDTNQGFDFHGDDLMTSSDDFSFRIFRRVARDLLAKMPECGDLYTKVASNFAKYLTRPEG